MRKKRTPVGTLQYAVPPGPEGDAFIATVKKHFEGKNLADAAVNVMVKVLAHSKDWTPFAAEIARRAERSDRDFF